MKNLSRWIPLPSTSMSGWSSGEICNNGCGVVTPTCPAPTGSPYDGIVLEATGWAATPRLPPCLIHEMGYYLGLYHTFEGSCPNGDCQQEGDRVCDTPPDNTTARTPCSADMNSCDTDEDDLSVNNPSAPSRRVASAIRWTRRRTTWTIPALNATTRARRKTGC